MVLIHDSMPTLEPRVETAELMPKAAPVIEDGVGGSSSVIGGVVGGVGGVLLILGVAYYFVHTTGATLCLHPKTSNPEF